MYEHYEKGFSVVGVGVSNGETTAQVIKRRIKAWIDGGRKGECWIGQLHGFFPTREEAIFRLQNLRAIEAQSWQGRHQMRYRIVPVYARGGRPFYIPSL